MPLGPLYVFLEEVFIEVLCPFFNCIACLPGVDHVSFLGILEIKPLSEISLANMVSHMVGSLFTLMVFYLAIEKRFFFFFYKIPFVYPFLYVPCSRGHISENIAVWNI